MTSQRSHEHQEAELGGDSYLSLTLEQRASTTGYFIPQQTSDKVWKIFFNSFLFVCFKRILSFFQMYSFFFSSNVLAVCFTCEILAPQLGIEPLPPALAACSRKHCLWDRQWSPWEHVWSSPLKGRRANIQQQSLGRCVNIELGTQQRLETKNYLAPMPGVLRLGRPVLKSPSNAYCISPLGKSLAGEWGPRSCNAFQKMLVFGLRTLGSLYRILNRTEAWGAWISRR